MDNNNVVPGAQPQPQPVAPAQPAAPVQPQPAAQPQPVAPAQPAMQPVISSGPANTVPIATPASGAKKSKLPLIIGCSVGAGLIVLAVVLVLIFMKGGAITVICNSTKSTIGITINSEARVVVKSQEIADVSSIMTLDLKNMNSIYKSYEKEMVDQVKSSLVSSLPSVGCNIDDEYVPGDYMKISVKANGNLSCINGGNDAEIAGYLKGRSAQELADMVQSGIESTGLGTCRQEK